MTGSKKIKKREYKGFLFLLPSFAGVCLFWVIPYLDVIRRSFFSAVSGEFTGLKNYSTIFENQAFRLAAGNTLRFFLVCIPLLVVLSLMIAVLLTRRKKSMQALKSMFLLPMAIPVASVVLLWKVLFHDQGLLNHFLETLFLQGVDWMNTDASFWVLVVSYLWRNLGYDIVPNLLPSLFTIVVLSLLNGFKVFREAYLVAGDYPQDSMYLLQHLFNNWYRDLSLDKMAAAAVVTGAAILILILFLQKAWAREDTL